MKEELVSFRVAKLAKEKKFQELCFNYYFEDGEFKEHKYDGTNGYYGAKFCFEFKDLLENWNDKFITNKNGDRCFGCNKSEGYLETYSAPTQSLLAKWVREKHHLNINISHKPHSQKYSFTITGKYQDDNYGILLNNIFSKYDTFEEALDEGLYQALLLLK